MKQLIQKIKKRTLDKRGRLRLPARLAPPPLESCAISLQTAQQCFSKSKMQAMVMTRNMEYAESQMKKLFYVEFLEFVCRLSKAVFTIDSKAAKRNSAVMRKLKEGAELPLSD